MQIKASVIQYPVKRKDVDGNMARAEKHLIAAARDGAELLLLPEMFYCGFDLENAAHYAQSSNGEAISMLRKIAAENQVMIVGGSIVEQKQSQLYNTTMVINQQGDIIAKYRKIHLFPFASPAEGQVFSHGTEICMFDIHKEEESLTVGVANCFDVRYPEQFRNMALRGARLFTMPASWVGARRRQLMCMCQSRACENVSHLMLANSTGGHYTGDSMIANPLGDMLVYAGDEEGFFSAVIDSEFLDKNNWFDTTLYRHPFIDEIDNNLL